MEKNLKKNIYMCVCIYKTELPCCIPRTNTTLYYLYFNLKKNKKIGRKLKISPQNKRKCRERYLLESIDYQVSADDLEGSTWFEQVRKLHHK